MYVYAVSTLAWIDGLQPIPRVSVNKGMAAMLVEQTKEVLEKSFVYAYQHGGDDVTWKPLIASQLFCFILFLFCFYFYFYWFFFDKDWLNFYQQ